MIHPCEAIKSQPSQLSRSANISRGAVIPESTYILLCSSKFPYCFMVLEYFSYLLLSSRRHERKFLIIFYNLVPGKCLGVFELQNYLSTILLQGFENEQNEHFKYV
jgi:hypothetical protein